MGRVQQARVADDQVTRLHRHVHLVGIRRQRRMARFRLRSLHHLLVTGRQRVQPVPFAVRSRDHSQAAVGAVGVDQVVHQEELMRHLRIADRLIPEDAVLMPVQGGAGLGPLADAEAGVVPGVRIAQRGQHLERGRQTDERRQLGHFPELDAGVLYQLGAVGPGFRLLHYPIGDLPRPDDQFVRCHVGDAAEAILDQLPPVPGRFPHRHRWSLIAPAPPWSWPFR